MIRLKHGLTQSEMADIAGYSGKSGYCQLENGTVKLTVEKAAIIAKALGENPAIFFDYKLQAS